jgi:hypothetical protein
VVLMVVRAVVASVLEERRGERVWISMSVVWRGSSLSQDSSCDGQRGL